jgi:exosome complex exonuclease DIS3/RRP44
MNRAVQGDVVAVELLPESEWKAEGDEVVDQEGMRRLFNPCSVDLFFFFL